MWDFQANIGLYSLLEDGGVGSGKRPHFIVLWHSSKLPIQTGDLFQLSSWLVHLLLCLLILLLLLLPLIIIIIIIIIIIVRIRIRLLILLEEVAQVTSTLLSLSEILWGNKLIFFAFCVIKNWVLLLVEESCWTLKGENIYLEAAV
jgi:hypothetical protein